jgi:REP element-mobilizing transposase RayT
VFSTKYRKKLIPNARREPLYEYFGGIARNHNFKLIRAGGTEDHVHLLIAIGTTTTVAETVQKLKTYSSKWMRETIDFLWQDGFSVFSVSPSQVPVVRLYIARQIEHHRKRDFAAEFAALLRKCGVRLGTDDEAANPGPTTTVVG